MAVSLDEVARMAEAFPEVTFGTSWGRPTWSVGKKAFAWERPFTKADIKRFGAETPPAGPILGLRVEDLAEKEAVLEANRDGAFFTIAHFDGYPAVLVQLDRVGKRALREALEDAWLACAPPKLAQSFLDRR